METKVDHNLNREEMMKQLEEALTAATRENPEITFVSAHDESSFFPKEINGWRIIRRRGELVPMHYVNTAVYAKMMKKTEEKVDEEETTSTDAPVGA
jgi:hypothetical protein